MRTYIVLALLALLALAGCGPGEDRVREIAREELGTGLQRSAILNANTVGPYSPAQKVGGFLFVSGQIALDPATGDLVKSDIEGETKQVLENLMGVLRSAGYDSGNVISTTVYLQNIDDYTRMNNIYGGYFADGNYPARVTVQVAALPRGAHVEISAIAYK
jgi:2-iminobutanoate/2-iminopropanoate deaminase